MSIKSKLKSLAKMVLRVPEIKVIPHIVILGKNRMLAGRVALITGGSSGIGFEIARAYMNAGADVIITGRSEPKLEEASCTLNNGSEGGVNVIRFK